MPSLYAFLLFARYTMPLDAYAADIIDDDAAAIS